MFINKFVGLLVNVYVYNKCVRLLINVYVFADRRRPLCRYSPLAD